MTRLTYEELLVLKAIQSGCSVKSPAVERLIALGLLDAQTRRITPDGREWLATYSGRPASLIRIA